MSVRDARSALGTSPLLALVRQALNDFETIPLSGSIRRAVRIANLMGDSRSAIRLSLEIRSYDGSKFAHSAHVGRYLVDSKDPSDQDGPAGQALEEYIKDRTPGKADMVWCHTISELEELASKPSLEDGVPSAILEWRFIARRIVDRALSQTFALLCQWERELTYAETNEGMFAGHSQHAEALVRDVAQ